MIRYYGIYAKNTKHKNKFFKLVNEKVADFKRKMNNWQMSSRPNIPCKHPGCSRLISYGTTYCEEHEKLHVNDRADASSRGYDSRWRIARNRFLKANPLCVRCKEKGNLTKATIVDHIKPHRGDKVLFWDESNWQPLCKRCHDTKTMTKDRYKEFKYNRK